MLCARWLSGSYPALIDHGQARWEKIKSYMLHTARETHPVCFNRTALLSARGRSRTVRFDHRAKRGMPLSGYGPASRASATRLRRATQVRSLSPFRNDTRRASDPPETAPERRGECLKSRSGRACHDVLKNGESGIRYIRAFQTGSPRIFVGETRGE